MIKNLRFSDWIFIDIDVLIGDFFFVQHSSHSIFCDCHSCWLWFVTEKKNYKEAGKSFWFILISIKNNYSEFIGESDIDGT